MNLVVAGPSGPYPISDVHRHPCAHSNRGATGSDTSTLSMTEALYRGAERKKQKHLQNSPAPKARQGPSNDLPPNAASCRRVAVATFAKATQGDSRGHTPA